MIMIMSRMVYLCADPPVTLVSYKGKDDWRNRSKFFIMSLLIRSIEE